MAKEIGQLNVKIGLDQTGFQNGIGQINKELKVLESSFKAATATLGEHGKGLDGLKLKFDSLSKQTELQKQKVSALDEAHKKSVDVKGKDAKATQDLEIKLNKAKEQLSLMENELKKANKEIELQSNHWYKLSQSLDPVGQKLQDVGKKMQSVGKDLTKSITLPIAGIAAASVKLGIDFQASMSEVSAISGATGNDLEALEEKAKYMGATTKFSASDSAEALKYMAMAGWDTTKMLDGLEGVMNLAAASGENLGSVSDIVTDALTAFGMQASEATSFADLLAAASSNSNTNVSLLGESFKYVAPLFGSLGYSAEDAALALGLMANAGIKGSQSGTSLRSAVTNLVKPTGEAADVMKQLGIKVTDSNSQLLPFIDVMGVLREKFAALTPEQKAQSAATLFGKEAMSGMLAIINASEGDFNKLTGVTREYTGAAKEMADTMANNLKGKWDELTSALEGVALQIYDLLLPSLESLIEKVQSVVDWFAGLDEGSMKTVIVLAGLAAAIGPLLIIFGSLATGIGSILTLLGTISGAIAIVTTGAIAATPAIGALAGVFTVLTGPIGLVIVAIAAVIAIGVLLYKNWDEIKEYASQLQTAMLEKWTIIKDNTTEIWENMKLTISEKWENIKVTTTENLDVLKTSIDESWTNIKIKTTETWENLKTITGTAWENIKGKIVENGGGIKGAIITFTDEYKRIWSLALNIMDEVTGGKFSAVASKVFDAFEKVKSYIIGAINKIKEWNTQKAENKEATFTTTIRQVFKTIGEKISNIGKNAEGTNYWGGGLTWVGERGPELINLPRGSQVTSNSKSMDMIKNQGKNNTSNLTVHIDNFNNNSDKDIEQLAYELEFYRQRVAMGKGGA